MDELNLEKAFWIGGTAIEIMARIGEIASANVAQGKSHEEINIDDAVMKAVDAASAAARGRHEFTGVSKRASLVDAAAWAILAIHEIDDQAAKAGPARFDEGYLDEYEVAPKEGPER